MRTIALALLSISLVGCGSDGSEEELTPAAAAAEIDEIDRMLDDALARYRDGDAKAAEELVGDAYLEHFEEVEHPLEERDEELMEDLEHTLSTEIRSKMKAGAPVGEVEALVEDAQADLDRAKAALGT